MNTFPWLSLSIWTPIFSGFILLTLRSRLNNFYFHSFRYVVILLTLAAFLVTLPIIFNFDANDVALQFVEEKQWIPYFGLFYHLGVDGFSIWFVPLTAFTTLLVILGTGGSVKENEHQYYAAFLILSGLMIGTFAAANAFLFYIFFESTLIPMYFIIGIWGGKNRVYAAFKFFLYTLFGSLLMLIAFLYLNQYAGTSEIIFWHQLSLTFVQQIFLFLAFFVAFAVKVPMLPLHTWLPDAHVEAPTGGSMILAAIMLKLGGYGFIRFSLPVTPDAAHFFAPVIIFLSIVSIIYMGLLALVQDDMKKVVAYSSIAHMGFVTLGIFLFDLFALEGAIVQMVSHGLISAAMFFCIGILYERMKTREINAYGGIAHVMPRFATFSMLFAIANIGMPGTSGFIGEFMVIFGSIRFNFWIGLFASTTLVLSAAYTLWMYRRIYFGQILNAKINTLNDINLREFFVFFIFAIFIFFIGLYPKPIVHMIHQSSNNLLQHVQLPK